MRIPTARELTPEEWKSLREIVVQGFTPTQEIAASHRARLLELDLIRCGMGGLIATPAGRIVARL
jgi:hypothetical protein